MAANLLNDGVANTKVSESTIVQSTGAMHPVKGIDLHRNDLSSRRTRGNPGPGEELVCVDEGPLKHALEVRPLVTLKAADAL
jgi:hypothetical protein